MKMILILLLMISLASCKSKIICAQVKKNTIDYLPIYTTKFEHNSCKIQCFDFNDWETVDDELCGPDFESGNYEIEACDLVIGFKATDMALELRPKIKDYARIRRDYCKF